MLLPSFVKAGIRDGIAERDTSKVTDMSNMFEGASSFNEDLSLWNITSVTSMFDMFWGATSFNQNLCAWRDMNSPYSSSGLIFRSSGCTFTDNPNQANAYGGSFCADDCAPSAQPSMEPSASVQPSNNPTLTPSTSPIPTLEPS